MDIQVYQSHIDALKRDVTFRVMTPDGYEENNRRYPVLYMQDGQDLFRDEDAVDGKSYRYEEYYRNFGAYLPKVIIVGIDCPANNTERSRLYAPYTKDFDVPEGVNFERHIEGQGKIYLQWLINELKPWIDSNYRTRTEGEYTGIGGFSIGALLSVYAGFAHTRHFSRVISLSGAVNIWMDKLEKTMDSSNLDCLKYVYLDTGANDSGRFSKPEDFIDGAETVYRKLLDYGFDSEHICLRISEESGSHSHEALRLRFPDAVRWIYRDLGDK
ncbi:MAG: alpha/beta hydrolase [Solobacterium sp.]|nr:alpha/beta hydrolase [Solobacterium sp.]